MGIRKWKFVAKTQFLKKVYIYRIYISQIRIQWKNLYDFVLEAYLLSMINNVFKKPGKLLINNSVPDKMELFIYLYKKIWIIFVMEKSLNSLIMF